MTVGSVERLGRKGRGRLCPAPMVFPPCMGRIISAEGMRIKGQDQPDKQHRGGGGI